MRDAVRGALVAMMLAAAPLAAQTGAPSRPPAPALTAEQSERLLVLGKKYAGWFLAGRADSLVAVMDSATLAGVGGPPAVTERLAQFAERAGLQGRILEQKLNRRNGQHQFWYESEFANAPDGEPMVIRFILTVDGRIIGIGLSTRSNAPPPDPA